MLKRTLRHAMTSRLFTETNNLISHSPTSRLLVSNPGLAAFVDLHTETVFKSLAHTMDALEKWPSSTNPREGGYSLAVGKPGETSVYEDVARDPVKTVDFGKAMQFFSSGEGYGVESLVEGYPWGDIGKGTVVDVSDYILNRFSDCAEEKIAGRWSERFCERGNLESVSRSQACCARYSHGRGYQSRLSRYQYRMDGA